MYRLSITSTIILLTARALAAPAIRQGCPPLEVIYARGTTEGQSNFGYVGTPFVSSLQIDIPGVSAYNVVYPASQDFTNSPPQGAADALSHMAATAASCPNTKFALAGWSQGRRLWR